MRWCIVQTMPGDFEAFYAQVKDGCLRALVISVGSQELAEDLLGEAFARAWARWPAVSRHPAPAAWVMRTALNLNVSWWRKRRWETSLDPTVAAAAFEDFQGMPDLVTLLATLPERQRQVLALRVFLDLDTRQAADVLGIAQGTVTAHLHRATTALRSQLTSSQHDQERSRR